MCSACARLAVPTTTAPSLIKTLIDHIHQCICLVDDVHACLLYPLGAEIDACRSRRRIADEALIKELGRLATTRPVGRCGGATCRVGCPISRHHQPVWPRYHDCPSPTFFSSPTYPSLLHDTHLPAMADASSSSSSSDITLCVSTPTASKLHGAAQAIGGPSQ